MKHLINVVATCALSFAFFALTAPHAQAQEPSCNLASLHGSFGYTITGSLLPTPAPTPVGPFVEVGRQTFDGEGNTKATATVSINGNSFPATLSGSYTVNPDCTGTITVTIVDAYGTNTAHANFVITDGGKAYRAVLTDQGTALSLVARKQGQPDSDQ